MASATCCVSLNADVVKLPVTVFFGDTVVVFMLEAETVVLSFIFVSSDGGINVCVVVLPVAVPPAVLLNSAV